MHDRVRLIFFYVLIVKCERFVHQKQNQSTFHEDFPHTKDKGGNLQGLWRKLDGRY